MKKLWENKLFRMLTLVIAAILVVIIIVVVFLSIRGLRVSSYSALEQKMISAAKNYYQNNTDLLPKEVGGKVEVDAGTLSTNKYMKDLANIAPRNSSCTGRVVVKNVNSGYFYQAFIDCGEQYKTTTLSNYIKTHDAPVTIGEGLYENAGNYIYRGENPDNYIKFAGKTYRIVQINADGTIQIIATEKTDRVVWDDRFNQERNNNDGINDYAVSRIRDTLLTHVNSNAFTDAERAMLEPHSLCVGHVAENSLSTLGMECSSTVDRQVIGLLPISSYVYASLDATCQTPTSGTCQNYNYLGTDYSWWTLTADANNTYRTYMVQLGSSANNTRAASSAVARVVLRLTENTIYVSGTGTKEDPYIIK